MATRLDHEPPRPSLDDLLTDAIKSYLRDAAVSRSGVDLLAQPARPVVVDANRLRGEIRALARNGYDTALVTLARTGFLHLFAAQHVFDEAEEHLDRWARETGTPLPAYRAAWVSKLRPLINEVSFSRELLTRDELARIEMLDRPHPLGDPDDVPTAIAAMVLAAPLLSGDQKALAAVYGPTCDTAKHDAYRDALFGGGRVLVLSQMGLVSLMLLQLLGGLGAVGIRTVGARTGALPLALTAA
ncbi:MAG TPA: PIN domain-containing protein, partial [Mycobacteriales bacterium]|nr:PIN domain-containing protein [Mycobacteriales bacterium]